MLSFPSVMRVFLCERATDMRKSFDGLAGCVEGVIGADPLSGHLFVFFNRRRTMVKVLQWDRNGFCVYSKRLEQGRFCVWGEGACREVDGAMLMLMLEGIELDGSVRRRRFQLPSSPMERKRLPK